MIIKKIKRLSFLRAVRLAPVGTIGLAHKSAAHALSALPPAILLCAFRLWSNQLLAVPSPPSRFKHKKNATKAVFLCLVGHTTAKSGKRYHFLMVSQRLYFKVFYHVDMFLLPFRTPTLLSRTSKITY